MTVRWYAPLLLKARELGAMINVHAENPDLIDFNVERFLKEGKTSPWYHYKSREEYVEAEADKRVVHWASHLDTPVYIVHMADKEEHGSLHPGKRTGPIRYLWKPALSTWNSPAMYIKGRTVRNFVCSPPMKGQESQDALWAAIKAGFIDTVATDHCPFQSYEKDWGKE